MTYSKNQCRVCGKPMKQKEVPSKGWICKPCFHIQNVEYQRKMREMKRALKKERNTCNVCGGKSQMADDNGTPICFSCWRKAAAKVIAKMLDDGKIGKQKGE